MELPVFKNTNGYEDFNDWDGKQIAIIGLIANPEDKTLDPISMPQFKVKLVETGEERTAYVDEVDEQFWTKEMKAVLNGQDSWFKGNFDNPYSDELADYFTYGQELAKIKSEY